MAIEQRARSLEMVDGHRAEPPLMSGEPPLGDILRQLADDTSHLVRQEVNLAKVEFREMGSSLGKDAIQIGIALGLGLVGVFAMAAFLIVALGALLGNYWLSSLIVSVLFLVISAVLANRAVTHIKERGLKPEATLQTLREDADWAKKEAKELKRDLRT